jgi:hypothetical protein
MYMDIGRGVGAPFKDPAWITKSLLGGVWAVVPFTGFALTGYYLDYIRNTAHGKETPLPEWSLFSRFWVRGLLASIAILLYMLPAIVLILLAVISLIPASMMTSYESSMDVYTGAESLLAGGLCLAFGLAFLYMIAVWIFAAAAITHYAMHEEFGSAFAFGEIKRRLSTPGASYGTALLMSIVISIVASAVASTVTAVLFVIPVLGWIAGWFVSAAIGFLGMLMAAHLFGQYAARAYGLPGPAGAPATYTAPPTYTPPPTMPASAPQPPAPVAPVPPAPPAAPEVPAAPPTAPEVPAPPAAPEPLDEPPVAPQPPVAPEPSAEPQLPVEPTLAEAPVEPAPAEAPVEISEPDEADAGVADEDGTEAEPERD